TRRGLPQARARERTGARAGEHVGGAGAEGAALGRDLSRGVARHEPAARRLRAGHVPRDRHAGGDARRPAARHARAASRRPRGGGGGPRGSPRAEPAAPPRLLTAVRVGGVGVGLVGAGKHGQLYLPHMRTDVPDLALAALSRRDASRGRDDAARLGCRFHADWRALVADPAVEAVIAVVPPVLHPAIAEAVAAAGKPLLIEKPLATTGAAAVEVVRVLRTARVPCLMAQTLRWNAVVRAIRARLPEIGALHAVVLNQRFEPSPLVWLDDPSMSGGGILLHTGVHSFDLVRFLTGC